MLKVLAKIGLVTAFLAVPVYGMATPYYSSKKVVTIRGDRGGVMLSYALRAKKLERRGALVRLGGRCDSACTLYLGMPGNQVCLLPGATFRFHKPYGGSAKANNAAAKFMMRNYPGWVRTWLARNGGLSKRLKTMPYGYASKYVKSCNSDRDRFVSQTTRIVSASFHNLGR